MQLNLRMEGDNNGGEASSSDDGQIVAALRKMMKKEIEVMVIRTVHQVIKPIVEDLIRKVVKEEIQSVQEKLLTGGNRNHADEIVMSKERSLQLKFLDEVSVPVLTGKEIEGKGGTPMRVALVDKITGQVADSGPESSAKVEILVLEASGDDDEHNWSHEKFNNRIIKEGDKEKPHFAKSNYISLKEGICVLHNSKLGHDSNWMKICKCRLGARILGNFRSIKVQEAWTESFMVLDSRSKLYDKHYPPSLSDHVWRLKYIGRGGAPHERLNKNNIFTVNDFLFLHSIDPQRLQEIVATGAKRKAKRKAAIAAGAKRKAKRMAAIAAGAKWKATVDHAQTCNIDDKRMYLYHPSSESEMGVIFDVVGGLKGVIHDTQYVPINNLSEAEKACAHKLLLSAFENRKDITSFHDETSPAHQFPYRTSDVSAATNTSTTQGLSGCDITVTCRINEYDPTEPGTSSQRLSQTIRPSEPSSNICQSGSLGSTTMEHPYDPDLAITNQVPSCELPDLDLDSLVQYFRDNQSPMSLFFPENETLRAESHSHQQSNAGSINLVGAVNVVLWMFRVKKRIMAIGDVHVQKRQRICEQDK